VNDDLKDALLEGYRFTIADDPDDPRFEVITIRSPCNTATGGPKTPRCDLRGLGANRRLVRWVLGRAAGIVRSNGVPDSVIKHLMRVHGRFTDPA